MRGVPFHAELTHTEAVSLVISGLCKAKIGMIEAMGYAEQMDYPDAVKDELTEFYLYVEQVTKTLGVPDAIRER
jgi:hypothetical protein